MILIIKSYDFDQNIDETCVYKRIVGEKVVYLVFSIEKLQLIRNDTRILRHG